MKAITPLRTNSMPIVWKLALLHVALIAASNVLVQHPVQLGPVLSTWGAFSFPIIFVATDLTVRMLGAGTARRVIALALLPGLVVTYLATVLFSKGAFAGWDGLAQANSFALRITLASLSAYVVGQIIDIQVFARLRQAPQWWIAPSVSTVLGGLIDTLVFFSLAFHNGPDPFMAQHWPEIATVDFLTKQAISLVVYLPAYGVLLTRLVARWQPAR